MPQTIAKMMETMKTGLGRNPDRWLIIGEKGIQWKEKVRIQVLFDRMHKYIGELEERLNEQGIAEQTTEA